MRTVLTIAVDHHKPIPDLAELVAGRAYTLDGVTSTEALDVPFSYPGELWMADEIAKAIHFPDCWDTAAYPTMGHALTQLVAVFKCDNSNEQHDSAAMPPAARDVLAERQRQIEAEGWTPEHDDKYTGDELSLAAASYAICDKAHMSPPGFWPWDRSWWKPSDNPRRNLVKAGALILAEIERLDRAASPAQPVQQAADDQKGGDV